MKLKEHQMIQIHAYADGELGVEACIEVKKLLDESEVAKVELANIEQLKEEIKQNHAEVEVSPSFQERLKINIAAEVASPIVSARRPMLISSSWLAAALVMVMFSLLFLKITNTNEELRTELSELPSHLLDRQSKEQDVKGEDIIKYISNSHTQLTQSKGPSFKVDNVKKVTAQINRLWQGNYSNNDFDIKATFNGYCVCRIPHVLAARRFSYLVKSSSSQKTHVVSLFLVNSSENIECSILEERMSKDRLYRVGRCANKFNLVQWQAGKFTYFMVSQADADKLVNLMDQILRR